MNKTSIKNESESGKYYELSQAILEAAQEEMETLLEATGEDSTPLTAQAAGYTLVTKLSEFPDRDFMISDYSKYNDEKWSLSLPENGAPINVYFKSVIAGGNELRRMLTYHVLPQFHPFGTIRSFKTTKSYTGHYPILEKYVFNGNALNATPEDLALITPSLLNNALDTAKEKGTITDYLGLFTCLRLWFSLTARELIPKENCLNLHCTSIDTLERRKDVLGHWESNFRSWRPFDEDELRDMVEYSLFWLEKAMPEITKAKEFIVNKDICRIGDTGRWINDSTYRVIKEYDKEFEALFTKSVDGTQILDCGKSFSNRDYFCSYTWVTPYTVALDHLRNAIFILFALVTGLRRTEMDDITFDDIVYDEKKDEYWVDIVRFKTSLDPNYFGEEDRLPLPKFVGSSIKQLEELRSFRDFKKQNFLFQSNKGRKVIKKSQGNLIRNLILDMKKHICVDRFHAHRFRKTIAEILINRNERNVDIIRMLFGHKSYKMTLRYIARNPFLVNSVALTLEENFTGDFVDVVSAIAKGSYSGESLNGVYQKLAGRPDTFTGKQLKLSIHSYVKYMLNSGEPVYIHRITTGAYCLSGEKFSKTNMPPCLDDKVGASGLIEPDPSNCKDDCKRLFYIQSARSGLQDNLEFYTGLLEESVDNLSVKAAKFIEAKITRTQYHLENLDSGAVSNDVFVIDEVAS